jgi:hypothetical protein
MGKNGLSGLRSRVLRKLPTYVGMYIHVRKARRVPSYFHRRFRQRLSASVTQKQELQNEVPVRRALRKGWKEFLD